MQTNIISYSIQYEHFLRSKSVLKWTPEKQGTFDEAYVVGVAISGLTERPVVVRMIPIGESIENSVTIPIQHKDLPGIPTGAFIGDKQLVLCSDYTKDGDRKHFPQEEAIELAASINGIHLPSKEEHEAMANIISHSYSHRYKTIHIDNMAYTGFNILTKVWKYELGGYIDHNTGRPYGVGNYGYSWSSSVSGTYSMYLVFDATGLNPSNAASRALGLQVRCLQD